MQLRWGNYIFDSNSCGIASHTRVVTAPETGRPLRYLTRCSIEGWLEGDSQAELSLEEAALRVALLRPYQNLRFLTDAGATTAVSLSNTDSISGVRVLAFSFPGDSGAEYATLRRFTAEVEAEFLIPGTENVVVSFSETVSFTGSGGPETRIRVPVNDAPLVRQVVSRRTPVLAVQSGQAVGHTRRPAPNRPLWPGDELARHRQLTEFGPRRIGLGHVDYGVAWTYHFESDKFSPGHPALPPL